MLSWAGKKGVVPTEGIALYAPASDPIMSPAFLAFGSTLPGFGAEGIQRCAFLRLASWGTAPGWYDVAPSALKPYARRPYRYSSIA